MLARLTILIIILKSALCCKDTQFIIDYATLYSYSEITIVTNMHEIEEPIRHKSTAYISYESTGAENAMEYLREMQDHIDLLVFIGSDHTDLLQLLANHTGIFHSEVTSLIETHPSVHFDFRLDTNIVFCKMEESVLNLYENYAIKRGPTISQSIGSWSTTSGLEIDVPMMWDRRTNLMSTQLVDTILPYAIVTRFQKSVDGDIMNKSGIFQDLFSLLQSRLNFSVKSLSPLDGKWGNLLLDNVSWSGMIGELSNNKADICSAGLSHTIERNKAIDFGIALLQFKNTLIQASVKSVMIQVWVYLTIFPTHAWTVLIVLILMHAVVNAIITYTFENCRGVTPIEKGVLISLLYLIKLSSDSVANTKRMSTKISLLTWGFGCYVVFSYYEAQLTTDMTSRPSPSGIT